MAMALAEAWADLGVHRRKTSVAVFQARGRERLHYTAADTATEWDAEDEGNFNIHHCHTK